MPYPVLIDTSVPVMPSSMSQLNRSSSTVLVSRPPTSALLSDVGASMSMPDTRNSGASMRVSLLSR